MHAPPDFTSGKLGIAFCLQFIYHNPFYSPNNDPFIEQPRREVFFDRQDQDLDFAFRRQRNYHQYLYIKEANIVDCSANLNKE